MANDKQPTNDELRKVRRAGFANSLSHLPPDRKARLEKSYATQDDRRERNVSNFVTRVRG